MPKVSKELLQELKKLSDAHTPSDWKAMIEGRDHLAGDDFIMMGQGPDRGEDIHLCKDGMPIPTSNLDLIAMARKYLPLLIADIAELQAKLENPIER